MHCLDLLEVMTFRGVPDDDVQVHVARRPARSQLAPVEPHCNEVLAEEIAEATGQPNRCRLGRFADLGKPTFELASLGVTGRSPDQVR
ncbi:hypothetical protein GCM10009872_38060 [Actinopolymorpha rutila]